MIPIHNLETLEKPMFNSETFTQLFQNRSCRIEAIRSSLTAPGELYDQEEDEWVVLIEGEAILEIEGVAHPLRRGDYCFIPKRTRHRVLFTSDNALWLGVFSS